MLSGELEGESTVVGLQALPVLRAVAAAAVLWELAVVWVVLLVAGGAQHRSSDKNVVLVAILASHARVFTQQLEPGKIVVKTSGFPCFCGVTVTAGSSQPAAMRIILCVARRTFLRSGFHAIDGMGIQVASRALHFCMLAGQFKSSTSMVEVGPVGLHPVMTICALKPKGKCMGLRKSLVPIQVAERAGIL